MAEREATGSLPLTPRNLASLEGAAECRRDTGGRPPHLLAISPDERRHHGIARRNGLAPEKLEKVLALIEGRLADSLPVSELAAHVYMSPFHFARMFKQSVGQAPHVYITARRMDRARAMLAETDLPLAEVARRVGYRTQAHFTGVFHEQVGETPRRYRLERRRG